VREHDNVPMEKVVRDNSDHLYPSYNTHIRMRRSPRTLHELAELAELGGLTSSPSSPSSADDDD